MNNTTAEYLPLNSNGNTHSNGNGASEKTPAARAWDTAREKAREDGRSVRDDEVRCIKSKALGPWAKLLFWILTKICWESSDFLKDGRVGAVCITGPQLKRHFAFPSKRLYEQNRKVKDKEGKVIRVRTTPGAIQELVEQGFVWVSRKQVRNIPASKWPNVFNLIKLVPLREQSSLGLLEDVVVVEDENTEEQGVYSNGGARVFLPLNRNGSCQTPENGLAKHPKPPLPSTHGGTGQTPRAGLAKHPRGDLPSTPSGVRPDSHGGVSQAPPVVQAKPSTPPLADPASRIPLKTSDSNLTLKTEDRGIPSPEKQFQDWLETLPSMYTSQLRKTEKDLSALLQKAKSPGARAEWQRRLVAVRMQLLGGPVEDQPVKPVRAERKPTMTLEQQKAAWEKEKGKLKAASKVAART
jgi:hypothetical protein